MVNAKRSGRMANQVDGTIAFIRASASQLEGDFTWHERLYELIDG